MAKLLDENALRAVKTCLDLKVDKVSGKGLSTNDFTNTYKNILDNTVIDVTNGVSQAIKDKVLANPATVLKYSDYYYVPQYQPEEGTIPTFYNCFEGDENTFRWLEISWVNMDIESISKSFLDGSSSDFVHKSDPETISGAKTFSANNGIVISGNSQTAKLRNGSPAAESGFIIELGAGSGGQVQLFQKSWSPTVDGAQSSGTADLGKSTLRWKNLYLSGDISDGTNSVPVSSLKGLVETTWSALKTLKNNNQLVPGRFYRITDYQCTTTTENTSSAGHVFDIIVLALASNKLSEQAWAAHHSGDTYFANNNLEAWQLWYCFDNDANRFGWALIPLDDHLIFQTNQYFRDPQYDGVKDNYCWHSASPTANFYIFTSTLTPTRGSVYVKSGSSFQKIYSDMSVEYVPASSVEGKGVIYRMIDEFGNDVPYDFKNILFTDSASTPKYTNVYTFSITENSTIKDVSLLGISKNCRYNIIKKWFSSSKQQLNFNVFYSTSAYLNCYNNTFGSNCYNNTFGSNCDSNKFGDSCYNNTFGDYCSDNTFGSNCRYNKFTGGCSHNTFGYICQSNTFDSYCSDNTLGYNSSANTFGTYCSHNTIGVLSSYNTFGSNCSYNKFGNSCSYNKFGDSSSTIDYCRNTIIDDNCQYLYIGGNGTASSSNYLQNIHIHSGITGSSSSNRRTITLDRNLASTNIYANGSKEIILDD